MLHLPGAAMVDGAKLNRLRVFAEAATTESFAVAAMRLNVTSGAVSQRIKALEDFLGVELFHRLPQGVELTSAGKRYAKRISPAMQEIVTATREISVARSSPTVRITIMPALAQLWLGPRMTGFYALETNANVEIWADPDVVDLRASEFDMAIRYGKPPFPGCDHRPLFVDELIPVASPGLIANARRDAYGLVMGAPLMLDTHWRHDFTDWLGQTGQPRPKMPQTQIFSLYSMAIDATLQGRGFMIGHTALVGDLLEQGKLRMLSDLRAQSHNQFHLLTKSATPLSHPAQAFSDWIVAQAGRAGGASPGGTVRDFSL